MTPTRRFALAVSLVALMTVIGAAGYILIEHMSLLDAFYMSVITISTVGFQEVKPLSPAGRLFTIGLIVTGVGSAIYLFTVIGELVVEGRLREFLGKTAMSRKIHNLQEHVIVCGYGRFGRAVVEELTRNAVPMVVIESDPDEASRPGHCRRAARCGIGAGRFGARRCRRRFSPRDHRRNRIGCGQRVHHAFSAGKKFEDSHIRPRRLGCWPAAAQAGGSRPGRRCLSMGWMRIAASILRPSVVDFLQLSVPGRESEVDLEEIRISRESPAAGKTIAAVERENPRLRIVAMKRNDQRLEMIPARRNAD